jgi:steroid 5-alpha reductase family enzyme
MDKSDKIRIVGYLLMLIGFIIATLTISVNNNLSANQSILYFALIVALTGGVVNSIGYDMEKKAFNKELREKGKVPN